MASHHVLGDKVRIYKRERNSTWQAATDNADRVRPLRRMGVLTHFYKIVLDERPSGVMDAIAVLLPHTDDEFPISKKPWAKLAWIDDYITNIDRIEAVSG